MLDRKVLFAAVVAATVNSPALAQTEIQWWHAMTGYYSTAKGEMLSMPFNSSSMVMWINKDGFRKAGLDGDKPPKTWPEVFEAAKKLKGAGFNTCGFSNAWVTWA